MKSLFKKQKFKETYKGNNTFDKPASFDEKLEIITNKISRETTQALDSD